MLSLLSETLKAIIKFLPGALARLLLLAVMVGALTLHVLQMERIVALELWRAEERAKKDAVLAIIQATRAETQSMRTELAAILVEVRGYREDQREELKRLRQAAAAQGGH